MLNRPCLLIYCFRCIKANSVFQCCIDLSRNVLRIGTTGTETSFLPESDVPECSRLTSAPGAQDDDVGKSVTEAEDMELARALQDSEAEHKRGVKRKSSPNKSNIYISLD